MRQNGAVETAAGDERELRLRYAGTCVTCGEGIAKGERATYLPAVRKVRHLACAPSQTEVAFPESTPVEDPPVHAGTAGASALREFERRRAKDEARIAEQKAKVASEWGTGVIGRIAALLAVDDRPRTSTTVWSQGAAGEARVAEKLDALAEVGVASLHDRRIPGSRANIDHIAVTPWGVWVVDAKRYVGKRVSSDVVGGLFGFGGRRRLLVGGRDRSPLIDGIERQVALVRAVVGDAVDVTGCLCFVDGEWPLIGGDFAIRGVRVCWPNRLGKTLLRTSEPTVDIPHIHRRLAAAFPPA